MEPQKTYVQQLEEKLEASKNRLKKAREFKNIKSSAPAFFEIIDSEISLAVNKMTQDKPLDYEAYLSAHGEVKGMRRIRDLINSAEADEPAAQQEVTGIQENLKQIKEDAKK